MKRALNVEDMYIVYDTKRRNIRYILFIVSEFLEMDES